MTRKVRIMVKKLAGIFTLLVLMSAIPLAGQELWPGDVNNNGAVNAVDLLYLGQAFGSAGPARENATTDWQPQSISTPWLQSFPNGLNYAYADCDGNGEVDDEDFEDAIRANFGQVHGPPQSDGYLAGAPGGAPRLQLTPSLGLVEEGAMVDINLSLGDAGMPISDFYGIALVFSFNPELLEAGFFDFDFEDDDDNWITADGAPAETIFRKDEAAGRAQLAITRLNQQPLGPGSGSIGNFSIVIEDIIVGLDIDTFRLRIDSVLLVDEFLNAQAVVPDTALVIVAKDKALVGSSEPTEKHPVRLFPNPASGNFYLRSSSPLTELRLFDALGRPFPIQSRPAGQHTCQLDAHQLPPGIYWLAGRAGGRRFREKIVIL